MKYLISKLMFLAFIVSVIGIVLAFGVGESRAETVSSQGMALYVGPDGEEDNDGTKESPMAFPAAIEK